MEFLLEIRVRPNSSRNKVGGSVGEPPRLVVAVQAPAVDGKANEAVVKELAIKSLMKRLSILLLELKKTLVIDLGIF